MNKLFHAELWRLKKCRIYLLCLAFIAGYTCIIYLANYQNMKQFGYSISLDSCFFGSLIPVCIVFAVTISMFVGTQYTDGAIRNRLIIGHKRTDIYLSSLFVNVIGCVIITLATYLIGFCVGIPMFGKPTSPWNRFLLCFALGIFLTIALSSLFHMFTMLISSKTNSAVFCILLSFVLLFLSIGIYQALMQPETIQQMVIRDGEQIYEIVKNPSYLTGFKRSLYQGILDILPSGQAIQITECSSSHLVRMIIISILTTGITTIAGIFFFRKKDIK